MHFVAQVSVLLQLNVDFVAGSFLLSCSVQLHILFWYGIRLRTYSLVAKLHFVQVLEIYEFSNILPR